MKNKFNLTKLELKTIVVLLSVPLMLTLVQYFGTINFFQKNILPSIANKLNPFYFYLYPYIFWFLGQFLFFFIIPALIIKLFFKEKLINYGLRFNFKYPGWLAFIFYLIMLPLIIWISYSPDFQRTYPFYSMAGRSLKDFLWFESFYMLQFFACEFFFRGYFLFSLRQKFSEIESILIMTIPYCMIHFGKPFPETISSIIAGIVLGWLALRTKSIYPGLFLHCAVALTLDIASLIQKGAFFVS